MFKRIMESINNFKKNVAKEKITAAAKKADFSIVEKLYQDMGKMYALLFSVAAKGTKVAENAVKANAEDIGSISAEFIDGVKSITKGIKSLHTAYEDNKEQIHDVLKKISEQINSTIAEDDTVEKLTAINTKIDDDCKKLVQKLTKNTTIDEDIEEILNSASKDSE